MSSKQNVLASLKASGVVAVIRTEDSENLIEVSRALRKGGVKFIEITMTVPGALEIIRDAVAELKSEDVFIGAGTVLDAETARAAIFAGVQYLVGPAFSQAVADMGRRYGVAVMPGALTPLEILTAWEKGGDIVKVFPAGIGGPNFFKDIKGPFPQIDLMPTGGVNLETAPQFIKAGACAVGVGGALVGSKLIESRNYGAITENARKFVSVVREAKREN
ncbi:MAG: bifunctional 4-hydroxy-2-oxoglutarate aldolase/2-dehydro-3-deoxy-phosphogluconate aldolase [Victivallales bacterium]|nr:bifunctional 4-hydroxy-2-oxoglutarate aldolase/2-dehydro-3-deoxy-phosphogluconate aldolase [Victivallales bacterium]